jgi:DNA-binding XRE family transcriptional regulator
MEGIPMHRRTNTTIEEINITIPQLLAGWNISEKDNDIIFDKVVGLQIRKIRLMRGKTQTKVAKAISVTFQQVQKYEQGKNACGHKSLKKICEYLDIDISFFTKPLDETNLTFLKRRENVYQIKQDFVAR